MASYQNIMSWHGALGMASRNVAIVAAASENDAQALNVWHQRNGIMAASAKM